MSAIYTPFSFILFYEVLLLVIALPDSLSSAVGKQFEIISLIIVRSIFKDIGELGDLWDMSANADAIVPLLLDMAAALLMFVLVGIFYWLRRGIVQPADQRSAAALQRFIDLKKTVALLLCVVFFALAVVSFVVWVVRAAQQASGLAVEAGDVDLIFFLQFFEILIFVDVALLLASFTVYHGYHYVFRNAGFVIATILLRISLTSPKPYDIAAALIATLFGIGVLAGFRMFIAATRQDQPGFEPEHVETRP